MSSSNDPGRYPRGSSALWNCSLCRRAASSQMRTGKPLDRCDGECSFQPLVKKYVTTDQGYEWILMARAFTEERSVQNLRASSLGVPGGVCRKARNRV